MGFEPTYDGLQTVIIATAYAPSHFGAIGHIWPAGRRVLRALPRLRCDFRARAPWAVTP